MQSELALFSKIQDGKVQIHPFLSKLSECFTEFPSRKNANLFIFAWKWESLRNYKQFLYPPWKRNDCRHTGTAAFMPPAGCGADGKTKGC